MSGCFSNCLSTENGAVMTSLPILRRLEEMHGRAGAGGEDLRLVAVVVVDGADVADDLHALGADVVEPPDERADVGRAGLGREQRLRAGEAKRDVGLDALGGEMLHRLEALAE